MNYESNIIIFSNLLIETDIIKIINVKIDDKVIIELSINNILLKLETDFENYCIILDNDDLSIEFMDMKIKTPEYIVLKLKNIKMPIIDESINIYDKYHIYQKIEKNTKCVIDFTLVEKNFKNQNNLKTIINIDKFPKDLLFSPNQIYNIIIGEIKSFNQNMKHNHIICPINNNPYYLNLKLKLENLIDYDYLEMRINLNPKLYPFYPPQLEFIKPMVSIPLVYSLLNLDILKLENWNSTISLEWLILQLVDQINPIINNHIKMNTKYYEIENLALKLNLHTKEHVLENLINITIPKNIKNTISSDGKYWKSGIGYGTGNNNNWSLTTYIKEQEIQNNELINILHEFILLLNEENIEEIYKSVFSQFLINKICNLTLLELEKNIKLYSVIFDILEKMIVLSKNQDFINNIGINFTIDSDINIIVDSDNKDIYQKILYLSNWYKTNMIVIEKENIISNDIKIQYEEIMKKLQFQDYIIPENHLLLDKYGKCKNENKTTMRIISEFSTFKNSLPLNWDSTIWLRVSKKNINIFSFFISGPKNTPYENGIFEFHAAFPFNYPETEPKVLLNTTGYGTVRFNPNLYNCGKVCLSLLGTWAGQESEKWNKSTSTFLQVLVSIQSLIFVEDPYFNEPGYEKQINTTIGKKNSKTYNEPLQINTIKFAINDMIKNPPLGMEEVIKQHFKFKKDEIIETTNKWYLEISDKDKLLLQNTIEEMKILLDTL